MIIVTGPNETIAKQVFNGKPLWAVCDGVGNPLAKVTEGLLFESLNREELLIEFFETQKAIEKTMFFRTREMLEKHRSILEQKIRATYRHI